MMERLINTNDTAARITAPVARQQRFLSLDVFRGMIICLMIIVNSPGKGARLYPILIHAKWFGVTIADLVFPSFLFAVGSAMSFSFASHNSIDKQAIYLKTIRRTLIMFGIGFLLYWFPFFAADADGALMIKPIGETRIMGVLQRIALCYFISVLIIHFFSIRTTVIIAICLLLSYWGLLYVFGDGGNEFSMAGNAVIKFDLFVLGPNHVYKKDVIPFDPEGILSTLPAVVNVLAGYWAGVLIQRNGITRNALINMVTGGALLIAVGLCWDLLFPISKKLWTSSFTVFTIGVDVMLLGVLVYLIELKKINVANFFFSCFGKNPLFIYLASELLHITLSSIKLSSGVSIFEWLSINFFQRAFPGAFGSLMTAIVFMFVCWLLAWLLHKRKITIRL
jgi:predicted acyltransferase